MCTRKRNFAFKNLSFRPEWSKLVFVFGCIIKLQSYLTNVYLHRIERLWDCKANHFPWSHQSVSFYISVILFLLNWPNWYQQCFGEKSGSFLFLECVKCGCLSPYLCGASEMNSCSGNSGWVHNKTHLCSKLSQEVFENTHAQCFVFMAGPFSWPNFPVLYLLYNASNWPSCIKDYTCCFGENTFEIIVTAYCKFQNQDNGKKLNLSHLWAWI